MVVGLDGLLTSLAFWDTRFDPSKLAREQQYRQTFLVELVENCFYQTASVFCFLEDIESEAIFPEQP